MVKQRRLFGPNFRIPKRAFPKDLARITSERWYHLIGGDYVTPPCPPKSLLKELLEVAYLTATAPEEARFPSFNIVAAPAGAENKNQNLGRRWAFEEPRALSVSELRRLAPAVDVKKSAIWLEWTDSGWHVAGLADLGTSWHRARMGLAYHYQQPTCLLVQVDRPGRIRVYQGGYQVATLSDGEISGHDGVQIQTALGSAAHGGLRALRKKIVPPEIEEPREFVEFEYIALWNTYAAIANSIAALGHGGALIVVPAGKSLKENNARIKYPHKSSALQSSFVTFIDARHVIGDLISRRENGEVVSDERFSHAEMAMVAAYEELVEATRFIAHLSGCDGAIIISEDLNLVGFGAEIRSEFKRGWSVVESFDDLQTMFNDEAKPMNIDEFGMRHRSAVKLVSQEPACHVLVVSQDDPISAVWAKNRKVIVRRYLNMVNMNMVGA